MLKKLDDIVLVRDRWYILLNKNNYKHKWSLLSIIDNEFRGHLWKCYEWKRNLDKAIKKGKAEFWNLSIYDI